MTDEFEDTLRDTFERHADQAPHVDLALAAVKRAGTIRRRRRLASGVAVLAVAAFVIPVGSQIIGDDTTDHTTSKPVKDDATPSRPVEVAIAGLRQGDAPAVPYVDGPEFHPLARPATPITSGGRVTDAVQLADAVVVWSIDTSNGKTTYAANNDHTNLPQGSSVSSPSVNLADNEAAWSVVRTPPPSGDYRDGDILALADTQTGELSTTSIGMDKMSQVMGVHDGKVIYNGRDGRVGYVGLVDFSTDPNVAHTPWPDATNVTAVDPNFERLAGQTAQMRGRDRACSAMFSISASQEEWRSCQWRPVEFSADGSLVLAIRPNVDGLGPRELAVLEADDGTVVQSFTTKGTFGRATFEGNESVDTVVTVADQAAIVRCSIGEGECELATEPAEVVRDEPASLTYPYQLTAN